jgi:hypothetical protein
MGKIESLLGQMQSTTTNDLNRSHQDRFPAAVDDLDSAYPNFRSPPVSKK